MKDKTLKCQDCGAEFVFTVREQEFYEQNNFSEPKRCKACRDARKRTNGNSGKFNSSRNEFHGSNE
jgi:DNA replicative helicase MCM subunit Mcm2 (Cdc46/Mcm family)